jgi:hypothetical protein
MGSVTRRKEWNMAKKNKLSASQQRSIRMQQIVLGVIGVLIIISMVLSLVAN